MINFDDERKKLGENLKKNSYRNNFGFETPKKTAEGKTKKDGISGSIEKNETKVIPPTELNMQRRGRGGVVPSSLSIAKEKEKDKKLETRAKLSESKEPDFAGTSEVLKAYAFKGLTGFNAGLAKTVDFFLPDFLTPNVVQKGIDYYKDVDRKQQEYIDHLRKTKAQEIGGNLTSALVQAIPNLVLAFISGGGSAVAEGAGMLTAGGGTMAGVLAGSNATTTSAAKALQTAVQTNAKNPMFWNSFAQTLGPTYEKEKEKGVPEVKAMMSAMLNATVGATIEVGGGIETLTPIDFKNMPLKDVLKTIGKNTLRAAGEEGLEELEQYSAEQLSSMAVGASSALEPGNWFNLDKNKDAVINPLAQAEQFAYGAAVGGIMGGSSSMVNAGLQKVFSAPQSQPDTAKGTDYGLVNVNKEKIRKIEDLRLKKGSNSIVKELNTAIERVDRAEPNEAIYTGIGNVNIIKSVSKPGFEVTMEGKTYDVPTENVKRFLVEMRKKAPIIARENARIATENRNAETEQKGMAKTQTLKKVMSPETESKIVKTIAKRSGLNIIFDDLGEDFEGKISGNTITISRQAGNPIYQVLKHELTHHIENSEHYDSYKDFVISGLQNSGHDVDTEISNIIKSYAESGITLSDEKAKNEYVASFSEEYLFNSEESINRLARENPNLFIKVYDWIKDTITKIGATDEVKFLIDAQRKYEKTLRAMSKKEKTAFRNAAILSDDKEKFSIKNTFKDDIERVVNGTFNSEAGEVEAGTTSDFMAKIIGAEPLKVTMPARKIYGAIMNKEDVPTHRLDPELNYHGLGKEVFYQAIKASETPIAAYVSKDDPDTGKKRHDTIALITDVKDSDGNFIIVFETVDTKGRINKMRYDVNKVITTFGKDYVERQIHDSIADGRILYLDKKRSHAIGGIGDQSSDGRLPNFENNISNFWANVNYLHGKNKTETEKTSNNQFAAALEKAELKKQQELARKAETSNKTPKERIGEALRKAYIEKEQKSLGKNHIEDAKLKKASENLYNEEGNKYLRNPIYNKKPVPLKRTVVETKGSETQSFSNDVKAEAKTKNDKASRYERARVKEFNDEMANVLGTDKYEDIKKIKAERKEMVKKIKAGTLTDAERKTYFDSMFDTAIEVNNHFIDTYAEIRKELKKPRFIVSEKTLNNIPDYKKRRHEFRYIHFAKPGEGGIAIDPFYESMREQYPTVFPEVNTQEEMIEQLAEAANIYESAKSMLSDAEDSKEIYEASWKKFNEEIDALKEQERLVKRYTDSKKKTETKSIPPDEVNEYVKRINDIKKDIRKAHDKLLLTDDDLVVVEQLLDRKTDETFVKGHYDNADNIITMYEVKNALREAQEPIRKTGSETRTEIDRNLEKLLEKSDGWKDKGSGKWFQRETAERNMEDIMSKEEAAAINAYIFTPIHRNEAIKTREKNNYAKIIKSLGISDKKEFTVKKVLPRNEPGATVYDWVKAPGLQYQLRANKGKISESTLLQLKGEGKIDDDFIKSVGANPDKINNAIKVFRSIYKESFDRANAILVKNGYDPIEWREDYFPHFSEIRNDTLLGKILKKLGYNPRGSNLPTDLAGLTESFKPGKRWVGNFLERTGIATEYDALKGMEIYLDAVLDVIHHTDDIQRVRRFETAVRAKFGEKGYKTQLNLLRSKWEAGDITDAEYEQKIDDLQADGPTRHGHLAMWLREYGNLLAGKKSVHDRAAEIFWGRSMYDAVGRLEGRIASNMIGLNMSSASTNFIPLIQAGYISPIGMIRAAAETMTNAIRQDGFVQESDFLTNRKGADSIYMDASSKLRDITSRPMEAIDQFTSQVLVRAKYNEWIKKGLSHDEAMAKADRFAADVIADRSKGSMPTMFATKNPISKAFTMFQLEVNNQWSHFVKDIPRNSENVAAAAAAYINVAIGSYLFNDLFEAIIGRRPSLDILSWINDIIGDTTGVKAKNFVEILMEGLPEDDDLWEKIKEGTTKETKKGSVAKNLVKNIAEDTPFIGGLIGGGRLPVSAALPNFEQLWNSGWNLMSEDEETKKKAAYRFRKELTKPLSYLIMPTGGGQLRKTAEGIEALVKQGSYGVDQKGREILQYSVDRDAATIGKSLLFGKSSTKKSQEWIDSDFDSLNAIQTQAYISMLEEHIEPSKAEGLARKLSESEVNSKLIKQVGTLGIKTNQKNAVIKALDSNTIVDYYSPSTVEFATLNKTSQEAVLKIKKETNKPLSKSLDIYNIIRESGKGTTKQALTLMEAGYSTTTLKALGYKSSEKGSIERAKAAKKAGITPEELELMFEYADFDGNGKIKQSEAIEYLNGRDYLTKEQKYYALIALCAPKEKNNPWR